MQVHYGANRPHYGFTKLMVIKFIYGVYLILTARFEGVMYEEVTDEYKVYHAQFHNNWNAISKVCNKSTLRHVNSITAEVSNIVFIDRALFHDDWKEFNKSPISTARVYYYISEVAIGGLT